MQIREHAEATPDKPAVIMHPSGTVVTFGQLEARANARSSVPLLRFARGCRCDPDGEQRALSRH